MGLGVPTAASVLHGVRPHTVRLFAGQSKAKRPLPCSLQSYTRLCAAPFCVQLEVSAETEDDLVRWDGWVSSRIRRLVEALQDSVRVRWVGVSGHSLGGGGQSVGKGRMGPGRWVGGGVMAGRQQLQNVPAAKRVCVKGERMERGPWLRVLCRNAP